MHVQLRLDGNNSRQWHLDLLRQIAALPDHRASASLAASPNSIPASARALFRYEALLQHLAPVHSRRLPLEALHPFQGAPDDIPDLIIDLCGDVSPSASKVWQLEYGGVAGETALLGLLLAGRSVFVTLSEAGHLIVSGRPGSERPDVMLAGFDDVLGRTGQMILAALGPQGPSACQPVAETGLAGKMPVSAALMAQKAIRQLAWKFLRRVYQLGFLTPHWRVGWRRIEGADVYGLRQHPATGWTSLPDNGRRFYADPFPVEYQGRLFLFAEDFPHETGKGVISAVEFGPDGPVGPMQTVFEHAVHLSYPFIFERDGQMWMIPETCAAKTVELYRATQFPGGWVREAVLLEHIVASDVTLLEYGGKWWMFASVQAGGGAYSDTLHLWSAPDFRGPWTPHRQNPVLIDMASARPAGRVELRDGHLLRPVQDCRKGYGAALGIARILRLDDGGFEQVVETLLEPGPLWPGRRLHTLNQGGGFEFIDGSSSARRW